MLHDQDDEKGSLFSQSDDKANLTEGTLSSSTLNQNVNTDIESKNSESPKRNHHSFLKFHRSSKLQGENDSNGDKFDRLEEEEEVHSSQNLEKAGQIPENSKDSTTLNDDALWLKDTIDFFSEPVKPYQSNNSTYDKINPGIFDSELEEPYFKDKMGFNFILLLADLLMMVTWFIDVMVPTESNYRNIILLNLLGAADYIKLQFSKIKDFYSSHSIFFNITITALVLSFIPPVLFFIAMMAIYTTITGTLFTLGMSLITLVSAVGFFPIFVFTLVIVFFTVLSSVISYIIVLWAFNTLSPYIPMRKFLSSIADYFPPSVGTVEVSPEKQKMSAVVENSENVVPLSEIKEVGVGNENGQDGNIGEDLKESVISNGKVNGGIEVVEEENQD